MTLSSRSFSVLVVLAPVKPTFAADAAAKGSPQGFLTKAAQGGLAEVELGKLARERASSDAVKQFADRMVADHGKANEELAALAQRKGVTVPAEPGAKHAALRTRLEKLTGAAFDRAYVAEMLKDHRTDVAEFRRQAQSASDPDVKEWTAKTLPTLEDHLRQIEQLSRTVKAGKSS